MKYVIEFLNDFVTNDSINDVLCYDYDILPQEVIKCKTELEYHHNKFSFSLLSQLLQYLRAEMKGNKAPKIDIFLQQLLKNNLEFSKIYDSIKSLFNFENHIDVFSCIRKLFKETQKFKKQLRKHFPKTKYNKYYINYLEKYLSHIQLLQINRSDIINIDLEKTSFTEDQKKTLKDIAKKDSAKDEEEDIIETIELDYIKNGKDNVKMHDLYRMIKKLGNNIEELKVKKKRYIEEVDAKRKRYIKEFNDEEINEKMILLKAKTAKTQNQLKDDIKKLKSTVAGIFIRNQPKNEIPVITTP